MSSLSDFFGGNSFDNREQVNGVLIQAHKYLLKRFAALKPVIEKRPIGSPGEPLKLESRHKVTDFFNTFKILYAS